MFKREQHTHTHTDKLTKMKEQQTVSQEICSHWMNLMYVNVLFLMQIGVNANAGIKHLFPPSNSKWRH